MPEFQVMIADGGTINCSGKCNKINLTMGEYAMNIPMTSIPMGGANVVLGIQWLQSLGMVAFNFQEIFMKFSLEGKEIELRGITGKLDVQTSKPYIHQYLQRIIDNHSKVFEYMPKGLPPTQNHDHEIHLIPGNVPPNIRPYRYPTPRRVKLSTWLKKC